MSSPLRTAVVGLGQPGLQHARCLSTRPADYTLVSACDLNENARQLFATEFPGARTYGALGSLLAETRPDVVVLATNETPRVALALEAVAAGVRGLYVEKPVAVDLGDARCLVETCEARDVALIVNHQRRTLPVFRTARRLIDEGAIGPVKLIRASCAGDLISDGTHLINTVGFLFHDVAARAVSGTLELRPHAPLKPRETFTGSRSGHAVEYGCCGLVEYVTGQRAEFHLGSLQLPDTKYQYYEIVGAEGTLRHNGDTAEPPLFLQHAREAGWRPVPLDLPPGYVAPRSLALAENYAAFARVIRREMSLAGHPLNARTALAGHEVLTAIYESARVRDRVVLPLTQTAFPLDLILREAATLA